MTKREKEIIREQIVHNKSTIERVKKGELWEAGYNIPELKLAFIQGMTLANDSIESFLESK